MASAIRMGHDVAVVVPPALAEMAHEDGVRVHVGSDPPGDELDAVWRQVHRASHAAAEQLVLGEIFGRLKTAALLPTAREVVTTWRPDIVIHETAEFSGVLAAEEAHVPHATIGISHARTDMVDAAAPILAQWMPGVAARILAAPYITVFPASLDEEGYPNIRRFRAPPERAVPLPDFWPGIDGPLVYVTFGTVTRDTPIASAAFRVALEAVRDVPARVLMTTGGELPDIVNPRSLRHIHVETWIPQVDVLERATLVVCHGGSGTTLGALETGVPLVIIPLFADQQSNARSVERVGAGRALFHDGEVVPALRELTERDVEPIRSAICSVLSDTSFKVNAGRIATEMNSLPAIDAVWQALAL